MSTTEISGVDCHAHVVDQLRFPYSPGQGYRPRTDEQGPKLGYREVLQENGISHAILVQPSCYGFDNRAMLDAIASSDGRWKGIAVVRDNAGVALLAQLASQGVVGARLNLGTFDPNFFDRPTARTWMGRMRDQAWLVQVYARSTQWVRIVPAVLDSGVTVIVDHFGHPDVGQPVDQPGFEAVLELGRRGAAYLKLAAPFRSSGEAWPHHDLAPFVRAAIEAFGVERCVFGSDWPFVNAKVNQSYAAQLAWLANEVPDAVARHKILVDNPVALYGLGRLVPEASSKKVAP